MVGYEQTPNGTVIVSLSDGRTIVRSPFSPPAPLALARPPPCLRHGTVSFLPSLTLKGPETPPQEADVLVGADGINSKVRRQVRGPEDKPIYSGYTCYTATCDYEAPDVQTVGYQARWVAMELGSSVVSACCGCALAPGSGRPPSAATGAFLRAPDNAPLRHGSHTSF